MQIRSLVLALTAGAVIASAAEARIRPGSIEASAYGGVWEGDNTLDTAPTFGVRGAYNFNRVIGIEASYGLVPTTLTTKTGDVTNPTITETDEMAMQLGVNAVLHLNNAFINPYVTGGVGMVSADGANFASNVGLGAKFHFTDLIALRADLRGWFSNEAPADDEYAHFEATLGVSVQFMGDHDMDGDGIDNMADRCPTKAEDKDGFEDTDGCPDEDNDKDGVLDADDKCPDAAEDKDGVEDEDGCPDLDKDKDGVDDDKDKCVDEAEDKDGFEDEDGCPDPDNDKDGVLDAADKCPDVAESKNGFQDDDGCPEEDADKDGFFDSQDQCKDEPEARNGFKDTDGCKDTVPEDLQAITGIQPGVQFAKRKATIGTKSAKTLDEIAEVLKKYTDDVEIVIAATAHKVDDADALAKERAEMVKSELVKRGVAEKMLSTRSLGARELPENPPKGARNDRLELQIKVVATASK